MESSHPPKPSPPLKPTLSLDCLQSFSTNVVSLNKQWGRSANLQAEQLAHLVHSGAGGEASSRQSNLLGNHQPPTSGGNHQPVRRPPTGLATTNCLGDHQAATSNHRDDNKAATSGATTNQRGNHQAATSNHWGDRQPAGRPATSRVTINQPLPVLFFCSSSFSQSTDRSCACDASAWRRDGAADVVTGDAAFIPLAQRLLPRRSLAPAAE